jgi:Zn finger protein HypA/HybF involved in hydrogenase expression
MTCPDCGVLTPHTHPPAQVTLLCRHCGGPFKTSRIVAVCPLCVRHQPLEIGGEMSGT